MEKPLWILKDKEGNEVWSTFETNYYSMIEEALKSLGFELVWNDMEICSGCNVWNAFCLCKPQEERHGGDRRTELRARQEWGRRRTDHHLSAKKETGGVAGEARPQNAIRGQQG